MPVYAQKQKNADQGTSSTINRKLFDQMEHGHPIHQTEHDAARRWPKGAVHSTQPLSRSFRSLRELSEERSSGNPLETQDERDAKQVVQRTRQAAQENLSTTDRRITSASPPALLSGTQPLPDTIRNVMGAHLGFDFSKVRIHTDSSSAGNAAMLGARAYTVGRDIMFGAGQYLPHTRNGAELLAHELAHVLQQSEHHRAEVQMARLRDWKNDRTAVVTDADIRTTNEYLAYMDTTLVWQVRDHMTEAEAIQACRYILADLQNDVSINWNRDARSYMNRARTYLQGIQTLVADQEAWLAGQTASGQTVGQYIHSVAQAGGYGGGPTPWWSGLSATDQNAWMTNAASVINDVIASVHGTPQEAMVTARGIVASPEECESYGAFAYYSTGDNSLHVGREWIRIADSAQGGDPLNVHDNIAHELGGHFEYGQYGTAMGGSIMSSVLANLSPAERAQATAGPRSVFSAYNYPETEIFAELREYDLRTAGSGGDEPTTDIPRQLHAIRDRYAPTVARAIVTELRSRIQSASNISAAAKTLFDTEAETVFPGLIPP